MHLNDKTISYFFSLFCLLATAFASDNQTTTKKDTGPSDLEPDRRSVWEMHWPFFLTILILLAVSIVLGIVLCMCLKICKKRKGLKNQKPVGQLEPALTAYSQGQLGSGVTPALNEDNGWIIPLDQVTPE